MKCKVCGTESGRYLLCADCNKKRATGEVIKCEKCGEWHHSQSNCDFKENAPKKEEQNNSETNNENALLLPSDDIPFLYNKKQCLMTNTEMKYYYCILKVLPKNLMVHMQSNLATFIERTDSVRFQNELYRNVDFLITDLRYTPLFVVEINDDTHNQKRRKERDEKVGKICEEAGIPILKLWTNYGVNEKYISEKLNQILSSLPPKRMHHFELNSGGKTKNKKGCYVATCVYGTYDCPELWVLRRYRDEKLINTKSGKLFVKVYYAVSPIFVKYFGKIKILSKVARKILDKITSKLKINGYKDTPYND